MAQQDRYKSATETFNARQLIEEIDTQLRLMSDLRFMIALVQPQLGNVLVVNILAARKLSTR